MLDQLCNSWSVEGSNNLVFSLTMARTKPSIRKGSGGMICCRQIATRGDCLPPVRAPMLVTAADVKRNEACAPACTACCSNTMTDPVDREVLEGALGQAFVALDQTDWESHLLLLCPLGFGLFGPDCSKQLPM